MQFHDCNRIYRVFIKYCVFFRIFENILDSGLSLFSFGVSVCTHTRQVEHQRCSRTGGVQKNHKILRKNTIINEHPVAAVADSNPHNAFHNSIFKIIAGFLLQDIQHHFETSLIFCCREEEENRSIPQDAEKQDPYQEQLIC